MQLIPASKGHTSSLAKIARTRCRERSWGRFRRRRLNALGSLTWEISFLVLLEKYRDSLLACEDYLNYVPHELLSFTSMIFVLHFFFKIDNQFAPSSHLKLKISQSRNPKSALSLTQKVTFKIEHRTY